jgi:putative sporulation protein YtxC
MELVSIVSDQHADAIEARLSKVFSGRKSVHVRRRKFGSTDVLEVFSDHDLDERARRRYVQDVARSLAQTIVEAVEPSLLSRILHRHYGSFPEAESRRILARARRHLESGQRPPAVYRAARLGRVRRALAEYLEDDRVVHVEGLLRFRLEAYRADLEEAVGRAVDDLLLEREYREFVRLLRRFVWAQPLRRGQVHLIAGPSGFRLKDEEAGLAEGYTWLERSWREGEGEWEEWEEELLSALIRAAPRRIVVHGQLPRGMRMATVAGVFRERLKRCVGPGCPWCAPAQP